MKQFLKWTGLVLFAVVIGLALAVAFTAVVRAQSPAAAVQRAITQATPYPYSGPKNYRYGDGYGPGMTLAPRAFGGVGRGWPGSGYGGWGMMGGHMGGMTFAPHAFGGVGGYGGWGYGYGVAPQGTPVPADEEIQLTAANFRFEPASITVKAGDTVRLVVANRDGVPHNLYSPSVGVAYTLLPAGAIQSVTFTAPSTAGAYPAVCTFHPGRALEIVVK